MKSDLNEWDDAESKAEAKESSERGEKLNRSHSYASLKLWTGSIFNISKKNLSKFRFGITTLKI